MIDNLPINKFSDNLDWPLFTCPACNYDTSRRPFTSLITAYQSITHVENPGTRVRCGVLRAHEYSVRFFTCVFVFLFNWPMSELPKYPEHEWVRWIGQTAVTWRLCIEEVTFGFLLWGLLRFIVRRSFRILTIFFLYGLFWLKVFWIRFFCFTKHYHMVQNMTKWALLWVEQGNRTFKVSQCISLSLSGPRWSGCWGISSATKPGWRRMG